MKNKIEYLWAYICYSQNKWETDVTMISLCFC